MGTQSTWDFSSTYHRGKCLINSLKMKVFAVSCLFALAGAAPAPEAEADPQFLAAASYAAVAAPNCKTEVDVLVTQNVPQLQRTCALKLQSTPRRLNTRRSARMLSPRSVSDLLLATMPLESVRLKLILSSMLAMPMLPLLLLTQLRPP